MHALPPLRQELNLAASPNGEDGAPIWTLYDPAVHRFYQLGWPAFEILSRWTLGSAEAVVAAVRRDTTLEIDLDEVMALAQFLGTQQLTLDAGPADTQRLLAIQARQKLSPGMWLLKHYLFIRIPLIRPMPLLRLLSPYVQWLYSPWFWRLTLLSAVVGLGLASRQWDEFLHTFHAYANWQGLLGIGIALSLAKLAHELGHALTAYRYGCQVPTMGVALLVMWPVLYTDTNEAWRLRSRRERLHIGGAGMAAELALAAYATVLWNLLPAGPLRAGVFLLATSTWIATLAVNASPFTRFDGYFLLSDWLKLPNLHERAFALTRWWLRESLFGLEEAPPELFRPARRRFLIGFSIAAWLYRLVLFFSIALLVYHFFFKALGLLLMLVEIGWFILLPIAREFAVWWRQRVQLRWNRHSVRSVVVLSVVVLLVLIPLHHSISTPALLEQAQAQGVYAAHAATIDVLAVHEGQTVAAGALLAHLHSPELEYQLRAAVTEEAVLRWQVEQQSLNEELRAEGTALHKHWETVQEALAGLRAQNEQFTLRAPFAGRIADLSPELSVGVWLKGGERLFTLVGNRGERGEALIGESDLGRLRAGAAADFFGDLPEQRSRHCIVSGIDRVNLATLDPPYAASIYGGSIPSRKEVNGEVSPLESIFRVRFDRCAGGNDLWHEMPGTALLHGNAESLARRGMRKMIAVIREGLTP